MICGALRSAISVRLLQPDWFRPGRLYQRRPYLWSTILFVTNLAVFEDSTIQEFLRQIAPVRSELDRLILFGSRARGDSKPSSDYDILV